MNIYRAIEDGEVSILRGENMSVVVEMLLQLHLEDMEADCIKNHREFDENLEAQEYHADILQSCELIGPLKN